MHIVLLHNALYPEAGGIGTSLYFAGRELASRGHRVSVVTARSASHRAAYECFDDLHVYTYPSSPIPMWDFTFPELMADRVAMAAKWSVAEFPADLVVARSMVSAMGAQRANLPAPMLYFPPNPWGLVLDGWLALNPRRSIKDLILLALHSFSRPRFARFEERVFANDSICGVAALSNVVAANLRSEFPLDEIAIIPPGISPEDFSIVDQANENLVRLKADLGIDDSTRVILYVGRLEDEKNVELLVRAFVDEIPDPDVRLLIIGDGSRRSELEAMAQGDTRVIFYGHIRAGLQIYYNLADIFVLPSKVEGYGQTLLEALACGTPCAGLGDNGDDVRTAIREIIAGNPYCAVAEEATPGALAAAILSVLDNKRSQPGVPEYCRDFVLSKNSWARFADALLVAGGVHE